KTYLTDIFIFICIFFFQAEDGIRDYKVTGVQTCALPICLLSESQPIPAAEIALTRKEKEQLLQKMYTLPYWIAVVRLFGYKAIHMDEARKKIKPLAAEYGKEPMANACEVLVEIFTEGKEPFARLKSHIRRMA